MKTITSIMLFAVFAAGCAGVPEQSDQQARAEQEGETKLVCSQKSHSGSRLGVRTCKRVPKNEKG